MGIPLDPVRKQRVWHIRDKPPPLFYRRYFYQYSTENQRIQEEFLHNSAEAGEPKDDHEKGPVSLKKGLGSLPGRIFVAGNGLNLGNFS